MNRRKEEIEEAYQIQVRAGLRGAAQYGAVGAGLATIGHYSWPAFRCVILPYTCCTGALTYWHTILCRVTCRRQTLPLKVWLVTIG